LISHSRILLLLLLIVHLEPSIRQDAHQGQLRLRSLPYGHAPDHV
jgi:hypothetical protein